MSTKVVFLGSKPIGYDCLDYLISQRVALNVDIVGIRTRQRKEFGAGKDLELLAREHGIPLLGSLDELPECDIIYSVQHHELLRSAHIEKASTVALNLHLAPLPEYRGCNQFSFAIMDEASHFGVSIHQIDTKIDNGDILFQERFPIPDNCWVDQLYALTIDHALLLFKDTLANIIRGEYIGTPQSELIEKYGSSLHFRSEIDKLRQIDLNSPRHLIEKQIRATYMPGFPAPYCIIAGEKISFSKEG